MVGQPCFISIKRASQFKNFAGKKYYVYKIAEVHAL